MAAGEMDIDRRVERDAASRTRRAISSAWRLVSEAANLQPVLPVQATRPARMALVSMARPSAFDPRLRRVQLVRRHAGDQQVLPDREPDIAVAQCRARCRRSPCICATVSRPTGTTTPIQLRPSCFCAMNAEMRGARERPDAAPARRARRGRACGRASPPSGRGISRRPILSSTYLSRALVRSVRSPWSMNTRTTASATCVASAGLTSTPVSRAKL